MQMERELPVRLVVVRPPRGVTFRVQRGRAELLPPTRETDDEIAFDFTLRVRGREGDGAPNFLGPYAQGRPADRFVYVNSGTCAGQADSCWSRRAKVPLARLGWPLVEAALASPGAVVEARIEGTGKDGGPACATVPLLGEGWRVAR